MNWGATTFLAEELRTEYATEPLGIDEPAPRFSWRVRGRAQSAYQLVVTSAGGGPVSDPIWDSGRVESDLVGSGSAPQADYAGSPLVSGHRYAWTVRVWDADGAESPWAPQASFETGLLSPDDWTGSEWIGAGDATSGADAVGAADAAGAAPLLRRAFRLDGEPGRIERARLYLAGLGYGEPYLDGTRLVDRVGERVLDPAPTDYDRTVLYATYDLTGPLRAGASHALGVALGRGRYGDPTPNVWFWERAPWWGPPTLRALLVVTYDDGRVERLGSDPAWRCIDGPCRADSLFAGERYDARRERPGWTRPGYDDSDWPAAAQVRGPLGRLRAQAQEPIRVTGEIEPVGIGEPEPGVFVVDMGQQFAGWIRLRVQGPAGHEVRIRYAERLTDDGLADISQVHIDGDIQTDTYVCSGDGVETYEPRYSYKGFRYVELTGYPGRPALADVRGRVVHSAVGSVGEFGCDDDLVNRIHRGTRWAVLNNLHGIPTDTPVYEKNGWTGDAQLTARVAALNFSMPRFYTKWMRDWHDAQKASGEFPPIVPTSGWGYRGTDSGIVGPIPAWDIAYVEIPWVMYTFYGDTRVLERTYDGARRYLDYLVRGFLADDVIGVGLGDYLPPGGDGVPPEGPAVYETAYAHLFVRRLRQFAEVLGRTEDLAGYDELSGRIARGFHRAFFDPGTSAYRSDRPVEEYRQSPSVVALSFGLVPEEHDAAVFDRLVEDIHERDDHLNTGVIGTRFLLPLLTERGMVDLAFTVATQRTYPGYGFWFEQGATALYEMWHAGSRSRDHHFYGHVDQWFYEDLAGLAPGAPGFAAVRVRPSPPAALGRAHASVDSVRGRVATAWRRDGEGYALDVETPPGVPARVHLPLAESDPGGARVVAPPGARPVAAPAGVAGARAAGARASGGATAGTGCAVFDCPPGRWTFRS